MEKVLLDTDIGGDIDDALCLAYLLKEPRCRLLGISTVCGESEKRAAIADAICKSAGREIPIAAGLDRPLQPLSLYPTPDGAAALKNWAHADFQRADAPAFLYQKLQENPREINLIGIGSMTNIAALFQRYPDAPALLKGLYVMNGYFGEKALPDPMYNWNAWADPLASRIVFSTRVSRHRVIPLDVTQTLTVKAQEATALFPETGALLRAVLDFGGAWLESSGKLTLHDPLAAVSVFYPDICRFERGDVRVETQEEGHMAETSFSAALKGKLEVARSVKKGLFYSVLSRTLSGRD